MELSLYAESLRAMQAQAHNRLVAEIRRFDAFLAWKAGYKPGQPRVSAGNPDGGQWTRVGGAADAAIARRRNWARPETLENHAKRHGPDFNAASKEDYARKAQEFGKRAQSEKLPTTMDKDGVMRSYDPKTNTFGAYNQDGTTRTFYKPPDEAEYFKQQINKDIRGGGKVINPLENMPGPENPPSAGGRTNPPPYDSNIGGGGGVPPRTRPDRNNTQQ